MCFEELLVKVAEAAPSQNWKVTVPIDQITDTSVAAMVKRAISGQPILGNPNMVYDGSERTDKPNPLNDIGFDLDDVIYLANSTNRNIRDLQDKYKNLVAEKMASKTTEGQNAPSDPATV